MSAIYIKSNSDLLCYVFALNICKKTLNSDNLFLISASTPYKIKKINSVFVQNHYRKNSIFYINKSLKYKISHKPSLYICYASVV